MEVLARTSAVAKLHLHDLNPDNPAFFFPLKENRSHLSNSHPAFAEFSLQIELFRMLFDYSLKAKPQLQ